MQALEVAFYVRKALWSFVPLNAVLKEMEETWPVGAGPAGDGWSEHRYIISQHGGDEIGLSFILTREDPLEEQDAGAVLHQLEELVKTQYPTGARVWRATQSLPAS
jgi:hypothetical protein